MRARAILPILALMLLAACTTPFKANVARFQQMPAPSGQSFVIQAKDPAKQGSLEFAQYASLVRKKLAAQGYQPASSPQAATLVVSLDYGVAPGREKINTRPGTARFGYGWGPYGYWPRWGRYHWGAFYDPFWSPFDYPEVYSYTVYPAFLEMKVARTGTNESVFEGRAEAVARTSDLTELVPNLVQAMFTGFPGRSGETVKVKIDPNKRQG